MLTSVQLERTLNLKIRFAAITAIVSAGFQLFFNDH